MNTILTLLSNSQLRQFYEQGHWRDDTIYSLARENARRTPDGFAVRDRYRRLSHADLVDAADRFAAKLAGQGVRAGQRVAVWLSSRVEVVITLLACSRNGYVCCPSLHRNHTVGEIHELMVRMTAVGLVAEEGYGADADRDDVFGRAQSLDAMKCTQALPALTDAEAARASLALLAAGGAAAQAQTVSARSDPDTLVYLAFTSGTTGKPKGVMHSDNTLLANARSLIADWKLTSESVIYTLSPLSHNLGFGAMITSLACGAELVVHDTHKGESTLDRVLGAGTTFLFGVPVHAKDLLKEIRAREACDLSRLKGFRISGAPVPREVVAELLDYGIIPQSGFGMTEACSHQYTLPDDDPRLIIESSGRACPGYEIRICSQADPNQPLPAGEVGQIAGRGASLMLGYFDDQSATEGSFNDEGWFLTGDLGWVDAQGYLRVTGRKKDVIIRGGHNIFPAKIEALAGRHPLVERAAAVPVADERLGEKVCLIVMRRTGEPVDAEDILQFLDAQGLSIYDMPEYFIQVDHIPLTASGKVLKRALVDQIRTGELLPVAVKAKRRRNVADDRPAAGVQA